MTGALVLQIIAGLGGLAGLGAVVNALLSRPMIRAQATNIATKTTTTIIEALRVEVKRVTDDNVNLRLRIDGLEQAEDTNDQKVRDTREALWECWSVLKRTHSYLTTEEKAEIGALPDVERFFR